MSWYTFKLLCACIILKYKITLVSCRETRWGSSKEAIKAASAGGGDSKTGTVRWVQSDIDRWSL